MERKLASIAALVLLVVCAACVNAAASPDAWKDPDTLVVGHTTRMNGNFFSEHFGNNTADIDVRSLLHEYPLVTWSELGGYKVNRTVIRDLNIKNAPAGDRIYTITLYPDLKYCDGSPVGAKDYVFNFLLMASPQMAELSGVKSNSDYIVGFMEYQDGDAEAFAGIRLLGSLTFSIQISAGSLPNFYELNFINNYPLPYWLILPGSDIADDGQGTYINGGYTADALRKALLDEKAGYISHPSVTSGPYRLVRYDAQTNEAEFEINPYYKGNYEGQKPAIRHLIYREVKNDRIVIELESGTLDLVNKVTSGQVVQEGLALTALGEHKAVPYPRMGGGFLAIAGEKKTTGSALLRQALAYCIDYERLIDEFLKGHGERVYGYYGLGQWMAREKKDDLTAMNRYRLDLGKAAALLDEDGWMFDENGGAFDAGSGELRHKKFGNELAPLTLVYAATEKNDAADLVARMLTESLGQIGGRIAVEVMPLDKAFRQYYRQDSREFDLLFMGTNFTYLFDPANTFLVGEQYQGTLNTSGIQDAELARLAAEVTKVPSNDRGAYLLNWMAFQRYWAEVLPMIPLYGNTYYDLFTEGLTGYLPQNHWNWGTAILYARLNR